MNRRIFFKGLAALAFIPNAVLTGVAKAKVATKPLIFGRCLNVAPALADPTNLVYQVHDGAISAIEAVRDCGHPLVVDGDDPSIAALLRAEIPPGHVRTCVAEGALRLGARACEPLTIDATGEALRPIVLRSDDLCGVVRYGEESREWRDEIESQGLLVRTWDHRETARVLANRFGGAA
jgi:hypothetical protein